MTVKIAAKIDINKVTNKSNFTTGEALPNSGIPAAAIAGSSANYITIARYFSEIVPNSTSVEYKFVRSSQGASKYRIFLRRFSRPLVVK